MNKKFLTAILAILGIIFIALAVYYAVTPAGSLQHFLPGYQSGSTHKHLKHALAALILAIGCGLLIWFTTGKKEASAPVDTPKQ